MCLQLFLIIAVFLCYYIWLFIYQRQLLSVQLIVSAVCVLQMKLSSQLKPMRLWNIWNDDKFLMAKTSNKVLTQVTDCKDIHTERIL